MEDPFHTSWVMPWRYLLALYIEKKRHEVSSWTEFCRRFGLTRKTVKAIRKEYGIDDTVGPEAQPSPNFRIQSDQFLGEGI